MVNSAGYTSSIALYITLSPAVAGGRPTGAESGMLPVFEKYTDVSRSGFQGCDVKQKSCAGKSTWDIALV